MAIRFSDIWPIASPESYKLHFARWNQQSQPLEVWARDKREWQGWQEYRPARDDFNRPFIFSLIQFYHEPNAWLFVICSSQGWPNSGEHLKTPGAQIASG